MNINDESISSEINRLLDLKGQDNWSNVRSQNNFVLTERKYSFGTRKIFQVKEDVVDYTNLQSSRNIGIGDREDIISIIGKVEKSTNEESDSNRLRIKELEMISNSSESRFNFENLKNAGFAELGFRIPYLMKFFKDQFEAKTWGYDVARLSIQVSQKLGHDGRFYDFNQPNTDLDLAGAYLVVSYHMLEHVSDPLAALKKIYESMDVGSYFHVEVPIEIGVPRIEFAHLYPFHDNDLKHMLEDVGFNIVYFSDETHIGGSKIERYFVKK
jgi:hypothetical protein